MVSLLHRATIINRPIALSNAISKLLEHILFKYVVRKDKVDGFNMASRNNTRLQKVGYICA